MTDQPKAADAGMMPDGTHTAAGTGYALRAWQRYVQRSHMAGGHDGVRGAFFAGHHSRDGEVAELRGHIDLDHATLAAVKAIHHRSPQTGRCSACNQSVPCPTVAILDAAGGA